MSATPTAGDLLFGQEVRVYRPAVAKALHGNTNIIQAIVLEQMHYWLQRSSKTYQGKNWVYKTYQEWGDELGLTPKQVRSALDDLRKSGLVVAIRNPHHGFDQTLWWTIDATALARLASAVLGSASAPEG